MRRASSRVFLALVASATFSPLSAWAGTPQAPLAARHAVSVHGGVAVIGNTLGWDCSTGNPPPPGSTVTCIGVAPQAPTANNAPDTYWIDNNASTTNLPNQARTWANLSLPAGATVKYARLYWAGRRVGLIAGQGATLERVGGAAQTITADDSWDIAILGNVNNESFYQSTADVTGFVTAQGNGEYRISGIDAIVLPKINQDTAFAAWSIVVAYDAPNQPFSDVKIYDSFVELAAPPTQQATPISSIASPLSFAIPNSPTHHVSLTLIGYGGDAGITGDSLSWNGGPISNATNPANNIFNSSRTLFGVPVSNAADEPALSGAPNTMASYDLDTFDVSSMVAATDTSATIKAEVVAPTGSSTKDTVFIGAYVTEIHGCVTGLDCINSGKPVCDFSDGSCEPCTTGNNGDPGVCVTSPNGHVCLDSGGSLHCGCNNTSDCTAPATCDPGTHECVTPCTTDNDCLGTPATPHCDTGIGKCVQCVTNGDCPMGETCDTSTNTCVSMTTSSTGTASTGSMSTGTATASNGTGAASNGTGTGTASDGTGTGTASNGTGTASNGTGTASGGAGGASSGTGVGGAGGVAFVSGHGIFSCSVSASDKGNAAFVVAVALGLAGARRRRRRRH